jgi:hypothetical protein
MGAFLRYLRFDKIASTSYSTSAIFWGVARERFQLILEQIVCGNSCQADSTVRGYNVS